MEEMEMNQRETSLIVMEIETVDLESEAYRYRTQWGISVVYYMIDMKALENNEYKSIYLYNDDVRRLKDKEFTLFESVLQNTIALFSPEIILLSTYLEEFEKGCEDTVSLLLIRKLIATLSTLPNEEQTYCLTNNIRIKGTVCAFYKPLLSDFCADKKHDRILVGIGNNDIAFIMSCSKKNFSTLKYLTYQVGSVIQDSPSTTTNGILLYTYQTNTLEIFTESF